MKKATMPLVSLAALEAGRPRGVVGNPRADVNVEKLLADVNAELKRIGDETKRAGEEAIAEVKQLGTTTAETTRKADQAIKTLNDLREAQAKLEGKLEALDSKTGDIEQQALARADRAGRRGEVLSWGQQVAESDEVAQLAANGGKGLARITVQNAITSLDGSAGDLIWSDRDTNIVELARRRLRIRDLIMQGRTSSNLVEYAKQITRTNNAAPVTEGHQKPESNYVWDRADAPVRTIAHFVHVSRQALDDAAQLQTEIDGELRYGLNLEEELQLLKGAGTGENLSGLVTEATMYSAAFAPTSETEIDVLRLAILQAVLNEYPPEWIVLHPTDWARIELQKDGENRYLWASPRGMASPGMWGLPVVDTQSMDVDEFLIGSQIAATIYDRMDAEVLISSEDRDNFIKNMLTVRAEKRLAMAVKRATALITGDFGNVT